MAWAIRNLFWLCWWGHGYDLIRKWMNGHKHQEKEALVYVCAHLGVWCGPVSQPVCVFSGAWQRSTVSSSLCWMSAWVWYSQRGPASFHQPRNWAIVAVHLWQSRTGWISETEALEWAQIFQSICDSCSLALKHWRKALYELAFPFVL